MKCLDTSKQLIDLKMRSIQHRPCVTLQIHVKIHACASWALSYDHIYYFEMMLSDKNSSAPNEPTLPSLFMLEEGVFVSNRVLHNVITKSSLVLRPWTLVYVHEHVHACALRIFVKLHVDSAVSYLSTNLNWSIHYRHGRIYVIHTLIFINSQNTYP